MCSALSFSLSNFLSQTHVILMLYGWSCERYYDSLRNVSHLPWFYEISVGVNEISSHSTPHPQGTEALDKLGLH